MRKRLSIILLSGVMTASLLTACGSSSDEAVDESTAVVSEDAIDEEYATSGGSVSIDAGDSVPNTESSNAEESASNTDEAAVSDEASTEETVSEEKPDKIKFVIVQGVRDKMFTLTNAEKQTLTIDTSKESGFSGSMKVSSGEYEIGKSGYYEIPYSSTLTLSDMDKDIVYVSAEYPYTVAVAVQGAKEVVISDERLVTITGKDSGEVFSYRVWLPSKGVTKESAKELNQGQGSGTLKIYWDKTAIKVEQATSSSATVSDTSSETDSDDDEDSDVASVDWRTACPWADKIFKGTWDSDGADLSNVKQLKEGIMSAKFVPVSEIEEESKTSKITFYDSDGNELGKMTFWQKGKHVEFDGKVFDYDDLGLD